MKTGEIIIYQKEDGGTNIDVRLERETVWLTQQQIAELFAVKQPAISKHLKNIFSNKELDENSVHSILEYTASDGKVYQTKFYNLDAIISVGYRVNSQNATQFRIWATNVLKEYLVKGYAINDQMKFQQYNELKQTVKLLANVIDNKELSADEATGLLQVITDYTYALDTLDKYDYQQLTVEETTEAERFHATYESAMEAIMNLKNRFGSSDLFGNEKDESFKSSISTIYQTFDGQELYPSVEEKAAMLLYLVTKNHSFSDGNKRIAAFLFLWFMERNGILYHSDGTKRIGNNALVALTLMIAESRPEEKDMMVKVVINLINKNN
ncbi:MAG: virulence RhuM family protein [Tannerella sp.]|jgi:prophage maintenance system killer protein|nr:virulence RhuM family protein [Tannerella sp.]